jgi:putative ABC transport system permease protein
LALCGLSLLTAGIVWSRRSGANLDQAFAGMFLVMAGYALLIPYATRALMSLLHRIVGGIGLAGRMMTRGVTASLSRTGTAVAALTVAVSVTLGMAVMIGSFRQTLAAWLEQTLRADIYISVAGPSGAPLDPQLVAAVRALPEAAAVSTARRLFLADAREGIELFVLDPAPASLKGFHFKRGDPNAVWPAFLRQEEVLVSEPYATRRDLAVGDKVILRTERGEHAFSVAGIYYDYGSDRGVVTMSRATYDRWWTDGAVTGLGLYLKAGEDSARTADALRRQLSGAQALLIRPSRVLRDDAFAVFDRTFTVTRVLQVLTLLAAAIGIAGALAALQLERGRELGVMRSLGFTQRQVWGMVSGECVLLGLAAGIFALPLGLGLALMLIDVIQPHAFGWTMEMHIAPAQLAQSVVLSVLAAAVAGIYPAWRMARTTPVAVLREE